MCVGHHREGTDAVHKNANMMRILQRDAQRAYEKTHSREEFFRLMGKNYLDEGDTK